MVRVLIAQIFCGKDQFIGLHDKNGVEVYEEDVGIYRGEYFGRFDEVFGSSESGDFEITGVVKMSINIGVYLKPIKKVFNDEISNSKSRTKISCLDERFEIIGNIHENPELMEEL